MEIIDNDMHFFVILKMNDINNNYMNDFISDSIKRDNRTNKQVLRYFYFQKPKSILQSSVRYCDTPTWLLTWLSANFPHQKVVLTSKARDEIFKWFIDASQIPEQVNINFICRFYSWQMFAIKKSRRALVEVMLSTSIKSFNKVE